MKAIIIFLALAIAAPAMATDWQAEALKLRVENAQLKSALTSCAEDRAALNWLTQKTREGRKKESSSEAVKELKSYEKLKEKKENEKVNPDSVGD